MPKDQTEKSRYPSRYGGENNFVTGAQYIIELICEKKARLDKRTLPLKFWKHKDWANFYKRWLRQVHKLLKSFDERAIINALKSKESGMRWSLHTEYMKELVEKEQEKLDNRVEPERQVTEYYKDREVTNRPQSKVLKKLKELD